jgi:hypothetical protein
MKHYLRLTVVLVRLHLVLLAIAPCSWASERGQDHGRESPLGLADLPGYDAALAGKPTAEDAKSSDPPVSVRFRDIWDRADAFRGRRVTVQGRVARIFRQGPVGSFPPLSEVWIVAPPGDPFCAVFPSARAPLVVGTTSGKAVQAENEQRLGRRSPIGDIPEPGHMVQFTGTFLRMVRYAASDGPRLAPLIVGNRPPSSDSVEAGRSEPPVGTAAEILRAVAGARPMGGASLDRWAWSHHSWVLGLVLALLAGIVIFRHHVRRPRSAGRNLMEDSPPEKPLADPPLLFVDSVHDDPM